MSSEAISFENTLSSEYMICCMSIVMDGIETIQNISRALN
jgi:hypothetical protein